MKELYSPNTSQYPGFKSRTKGSTNSIHHEENDAQIIERCQEQRRLSRLYGSKTRNLKKGKSKNKKISAVSNKGLTKNDTVKKSNNDSNGSLNYKKDKQVQKFFDRPTDELLAEIHADNYNISHPWFVGYQNTTSLQGSPHALASRYGYNGAIQITKQCSKRQGDLVALLDQSLYGKCTPKLREVRSAPTKSDFPGRRNQHPFVPESKQHQSGQRSRLPQSGFTACDNDRVKTKNLDRAIERELDVWENIITRAKCQRTPNGKKQRDVYKTKLTKHCARSIQMKHAGVKSHKVFLLS